MWELPNLSLKIGMLVALPMPPDETKGDALPRLLFSPPLNHFPPASPPRQLGTESRAGQNQTDRQDVRFLRSYLTLPKGGNDFIERGQFPRGG